MHTAQPAHKNHDVIDPVKHTKGQQPTLQDDVKDDVTEDVVNLSIKEEGVSQVDLEQTAFQTLKGK